MLNIIDLDPMEAQKWALAVQPFIIMMHFSVRKLYLHCQREKCMQVWSFNLIFCQNYDDMALIKFNDKV